MNCVFVCDDIKIPLRGCSEILIHVCVHDGASGLNIPIFYTLFVTTRFLRNSTQILLSHIKRNSYSNFWCVKQLEYMYLQYTGIKKFNSVFWFSITMFMKTHIFISNWGWMWGFNCITWMLDLRAQCCLKQFPIALLYQTLYQSSYDKKLIKKTLRAHISTGIRNFKPSTQPWLLIKKCVIENAPLNLLLCQAWKIVCSLPPD